MNGNDKTLSLVAKSTLSHVLHEGAKCQRIDMIFDVHRDTSIKDAERFKRGFGISIQFRNISLGYNIQHWRMLLCSSTNKAILIKFLLN